jgi:hypothetical protein
MSTSGGITSVANSALHKIFGPEQALSRTPLLASVVNADQAARQDVIKIPPSPPSWLYETVLPLSELVREI